MIDRAVEFLRIADMQASDEKIRNRSESATDVADQISAASNRQLLLSMVQGVVSGFDKLPFVQDSPAITLIIKAIKDNDLTLPSDLKENALELRAVAAIAIGELLARHSEAEDKDAALLVALSLKSALSLRPSTTAKHIRLALRTLLTAGDEVLSAHGRIRRKRANTALEGLLGLEEPAATADLWEILVPRVQEAIKEVNDQAAIDREEIEMLWWMFAAYSEIERKPLAEMSPAETAFCSGVEIAKRSLLPPTANSPEMVKRIVNSGRKASSLTSISVEEFAKVWSESMRSSFLPHDPVFFEAIENIPAIVPLSWVSRHLSLTTTEVPKLGKDFIAATGLPLNLSHGPADWGSQIFREVILRRILAETKETQP